ncbi:uncharacterized protein Nmag_3527 [Natrialba magadii ATCC 43099]|uniref:Uncharacterized protein n=1 Tax=Natrialba magadii (strain ATCC 43099 / DSM 3394 / CCM 3739 / CIP 104546 / IAM 13178 / JCM 8861 / NBRC 102185 / NCIMB 2190 / MS3) TaxID=547559 RepID=D3STY8_NATMM|nr:hypothetical protein [Natrialba magadii]ADD07077.1 uncharacterized protein Nmag_3527 [Natrialba magadii ATCC 43099]ELY28780.1 hypothetical protein C500_12580 [Natrialba magadii ATCC 43099]
MKTLEVTDEQYEFIQRLREEISRDVVGRYGFVREQDALQFLIDNIDEEVANAIDLDAEFSATDDVAASVGAAIEGEKDPHALEEITYDEVGDVEGAIDEAASDSGAGSSLDESADDSSDGTVDEEVNEEVDADDSDGGEATGDSDGSDGSDDSDTTSGEADDDDMLDEMMSLLETHDDKWEESSSADYRYTVTLPDGSTEDVQTKDDVRALLFKNYR